MSHDQKPTKMRLTASGGAPGAIPPARRRGDVVVDGASPATAAASSGATARAPGSSARGGASRMVLCGLFLVGCAAGGVALPLLGWM